MFDPGVSVMVSRDMDSLLTSREAQAVTQWLEETSLPFHVMRYLILDIELNLDNVKLTIFTSGIIQVMEVLC